MIPSSGSGGGYYGGKSSEGYGGDIRYKAVSSSGSSYVAGFPTCPEFTNSLGSVFGYKLINPHISNGFSVFPSINPNEYEIGHQGNGAIKITRLESYSVCSQRKVNNNILYLAFLTVASYSNYKY